MYLPYVMRRMGIDLGRATDKWCEILRGLGVLEVFSFGLSFGAFLFLLFLADFTALFVAGNIRASAVVE